jgi:type IV pilus assembly protein PilW
MNKPGTIGLTVRSTAGFSLVEIMVSLVISLFILGGAVTILMQNQQNYRQNDDFGRLQENARLALELLVSDLRMVDFWGCTTFDRNRTNLVLGVVPESGTLLDTTVSLDGFEEGTLQWDAQNNNEIVGDILPGTDAVTVRKLRNSGVPIAASMLTASDLITLREDTSPVGEGQMAAIYDCAKVNIFRVTAATPTTLAHDSSMNTDDRFTRTYQQTEAHAANPEADPNGMKAQTFVAPFDVVRYYISDPDGENKPALWRQFHDGNNVVSHPVVEGVENMQILYGENTTQSGEPANFVNANQVNDWERVVAVRITLLVRSPEENPTQEVDTGTYDIHGTPELAADDISPGGHYTRKLVSTTVLLRNMQASLEGR